jgi:hypothetical protein
LLFTRRLLEEEEDEEQEQRRKGMNDTCNGSVVSK